MAFDEQAMIAQLDAEIARLQKIRAQLTGASTTRRGRPRKSVAATGPRPKRTMSAAARKRLAESARKRWAAAKKAGKTSL